MDKKLIFYSELYRDSSIDQNAKQKIRDLVEDIQTYQRHLNQYLEVPIVEIDFRDVKDIAYTVGTFKDKRSKLVQELFSPINPLDEKGRSVSNFYEKLKKENVLLPGFFIDEVFENSKILLRYTLEESEINSQIIPSIKSISDHFIDYKKRAVILDKYNKYHVFLKLVYLMSNIQFQNSSLCLQWIGKIIYLVKKE